MLFLIEAYLNGIRQEVNHNLGQSHAVSHNVLWNIWCHDIHNLKENPNMAWGVSKDRGIIEQGKNGE